MDDFGLQTHTTVMKEKDVLANLPEPMLRFMHNARNFISKFLATTHSLKRNGPSAPDLLHQLFLAYLTCPYKYYYNYVNHFLGERTAHETIISDEIYLVQVQYITWQRAMKITRCATNTYNCPPNRNKFTKIEKDWWFHKSQV